jgi:hypothetical protein
VSKLPLSGTASIVPKVELPLNNMLASVAAVSKAMSVISSILVTLQPFGRHNAAASRREPAPCARDIARPTADRNAVPALAGSSR